MGMLLRDRIICIQAGQSLAHNANTEDDHGNLQI